MWVFLNLYIFLYKKMFWKKEDSFFFVIGEEEIKKEDSLWNHGECELLNWINSKAVGYALLSFGFFLLLDWLVHAKYTTLFIYLFSIRKK